MPKTIKQFGIETYFNSGTDNRFTHFKNNLCLGDEWIVFQHLW